MTNKCKSLSDIFKFFQKIKSPFTQPQTFLFRGEGKLYKYSDTYQAEDPQEKVKLDNNVPIPSLFRNSFIEPPGRWDCHSESELYYQFLNRHHELQKKEVLFNLMIQRHYGMPSRLLDWTRNLLVAIFFAVQNDDLSSEDGIIHCYCHFHGNFKSLAYITRQLSEFIAGFASCPNVSSFCRYLIDVSQSIDIPFYQKSWEEMSDEDIKDKIWPEFDRLVQERLLSLTSDNLHKLKKLRAVISLINQTPLVIEPPRIDQRIVAQHSLFTVHAGYIKSGWRAMNPILLPIRDIAIATDGNTINVPNLNSIIIEGSNKSAIKQELEKLGIDQASLFPDDIEKSIIKIKESTKGIFAGTGSLRHPPSNGYNPLLMEEGF